MLDQLGLTEFDVFNQWTDAPEGVLLQIGYNGIAIGWRCSSLDQTTRYLLIVAAKDQRDVGLLIDADTQIFPALDVSRVLELALVNPCVGDAGFSWRGSVLWDSSAAFIQSTTLDEETTGYACIRESTNYAVGRVYHELRPQRLDLGKISVRRRLL